MKLLLRKNISKLGIVGDIVDVTAGYGRNYLLPRGLAIEPTETNKRALAEARRAAEEERAAQRRALEHASEKIHGIEITVRARANEDGALYGSVGRREIAAALIAEGHEVTLDHVALKEPIRRLDNVNVDVKLAEDLKATVKVWVVRDQAVEGEEEEKAEARPAAEKRQGGPLTTTNGVDAEGMEASEDDQSPDGNR